MSMSIHYIVNRSEGDYKVKFLIVLGILLQRNIAQEYIESCSYICT